MLLKAPGILHALQMLKTCLLRLAENLLEGMTEAGLLSWDLMRILKYTRRGTCSKPRRFTRKIKAIRHKSVSFKRKGSF